MSERFLPFESSSIERSIVMQDVLPITIAPSEKHGITRLPTKQILDSNTTMHCDEYKSTRTTSSRAKSNNIEYDTTIVSPDLDYTSHTLKMII